MSANQIQQCPFCPEYYEKDSEKLYWHIKIHGATSGAIYQPDRSICTHCYCTNTLSNGQQTSSAFPHQICCKCGDRRIMQGNQFNTTC